MIKYVEQQEENAKADQEFCADFRRVYGPLNFDKPASLTCVYDTDRNLNNCGDAEEYDEKCEKSDVISLPPQDEHDGNRVPNIVILGKYKLYLVLSIFSRFLIFFDFQEKPALVSPTFAMV